MMNSIWKINKQRDDHLLIIASFLLILRWMLDELKGDVFDGLDLFLMISSSWVYFWVLRHRNKLTKGGLLFFSRGKCVCECTGNWRYLLGMAVQIVS